MSFNGDVYGKRTLDFVEDMQRIEDYTAILVRIRAELEWFGFSFVTVGTLPGPAVDPQRCVLMNTRPEDYNRHYLEQDYVHRDPVILAVRSFSGPFSWSDVRGMKLSKTGRRIIDEASDFGARDGLVIPMFEPNGTVSLFSPCGQAPNLSPRARSALDLIGIYSTHALQRAVRRAGLDPQRVPLTDREREVMRWVAIGKTDDEIATILSISRTTATTHVENAKLKLNAPRRAQAVMQALRVGEITL